jgi:hypothetical protein
LPSGIPTAAIKTFAAISAIAARRSSSFASGPMIALLRAPPAVERRF